MAEIMRRVAATYGVPASRIKSRSRKRRYTQARLAFCYWSRIHGFSNGQIARTIRRDPSTVQYAVDTYPTNAVRYRDDRATDCMLAVAA